jgi:ubiquinone/menaquinone biosynthesis C-methylase UbiE
MNNPLTIAKRSPDRAASPDCFAAQYHELRKAEGRIYTDSELQHLPDIDPSHMYYEEWQVRKNSCNRLLKYLKQKQGPISILEMGCGNGWLTAQLATVENATITGADINVPELEQAIRVFGSMQNVHFVYGDMYDEQFDEKVFDVIIFAASIQYFPSVKHMLQKALQHVTLQGEIHILDTHLYKPEDLAAAEERSAYYFTSIGFPEMASCYFHHSVEEVKKFEHKFLYDPAHWLNKFSSNKNPFYHVLITNGCQ